jgi:dolichol-phosphate mannosyltransferase
MKIDPSEVLNALIVPTYNETETLPIFLIGIIEHLKNDTAIIISDDSDLNHANEMNQIVRKFIQEYGVLILLNSESSKNGRGSAVHRGMRQALQEFANIETITECDVDGSHRSEDIIKVLYSDTNADLLIGSRYLPNSKISGWPLQRRVFSRIINWIVPRFLHIQITDITNGLRKYSSEAAELLVKSKPINKGFIYLSEQALTINSNKMKIKEIPIHFVDRTVGESTVTFQEVKMSIIGIIKLLKNNA